MRLSPSSFPGLALALAVMLPATAVSGQVTVTDVTPTDITFGTVVTFTGTDFDGGGKPKITATHPETKGKVTFKVTEWTDTSITAEVKKIPSSKKDPAVGKQWTPSIKPKGKDAAEEATADGFLLTAVAPSIMSVEGADGVAPGDVVTVNVENAGKKKLKAKIGGKKTKLKKVTSADGLDNIIVFEAKVPKSLANGSWAFEIINKIGNAIQEGAVDVTGSTQKIGKETFVATIDGQNFKTGGQLLGGSSSGFQIAFVASGGSNPTKSFAFSIPYVEGQDVPGAKFTGPPLVVSYMETTVQGSVPTILTWMPQTICVTVTAVSGGQVAGTFDGTFTGPSTIDISGEFIVDLE